jgi:hypothetical protein
VIATVIRYPIPPHLSEAYGEIKYFARKFPITETIAKEVVGLPAGAKSRSDCQVVIKSVPDLYA